MLPLDLPGSWDFYFPLDECTVLNDQPGRMNVAGDFGAFADEHYFFRLGLAIKQTVNLYLARHNLGPNLSARRDCEPVVRHVNAAMHLAEDC